MTGVMGLPYLGGVRITHSYFSADYSGYAPQFSELKGYLGQAEANKFNGYVGRLGYMLDQIMNDCGVFVYYGIEDVQAKIRPSHTALTGAGAEGEAGNGTKRITRRIYEAGYDFSYADAEDMVSAAESIGSGAGNTGAAEISGCKVEVIIIPGLDVMREEALSALVKLKKAGIPVFFLNKLPMYGTGENASISVNAKGFTPCSEDELMDSLRNNNGFAGGFTAESDAMLIKGRFNKNGREMWLILNNTRKPAEVTLDHKTKRQASLYNPMDGSISRVVMGNAVRIESYRGIFIVFDC